MTMQQMVEYLEACGFKATKKYIPARKLYEFHVSMGDNHLVRHFEYPTGVEELTKGRLQKEFLDKICHDFIKEFGGNRGIRTAQGGMTMHYCDYSKFSVSPSGSAIKDVIFNDPATIVYWADGTKTVVKAGNEEFDPEKGLAMAIAKKALGNKGNYFEIIKKWVKKYNRPEVPEIPELKLGKLTMEIDGTKIAEAANNFVQGVIDGINEKHMKKKVIDK